MSLLLTDAERVLVLRLTDEVLNARGLRAAVERLNETSAPFLHLDLSRVRFPTAEGLGVLVRFNQALRARGGGLVLFNVSADAYEVFEETRLVDVLEVRPLDAPET